MYIWIACDVSKSLDHIRELCNEKNKSLGLCDVAFTLPQHISLKISFEVPDKIATRVIDDISEYLSMEHSFALDAPRPELFGSILWLKFENSEILSRLHGELDSLLLDKYAIPQHEFDKSFAFHSTLFIDGEKNLLPMYEYVLTLDLPRKVDVSSFIIGTSDSGKAGTYSVIKTISAQK